MEKAESKKRAKELLEKMTLREKVGQLNQRLYGFWCYEKQGDEVVLSEEFCAEVEKYSGLGVLYGLYRADPWSERNYENGLYGISAIHAYNQAQRYVIEHSRLGIPMLLSTECPHGHQALGGYLLPVNLAVGATFDPKLYEEACKISARQLKELGVNLALVSMLDVLRDPRWGRSEECYSEDPVLCAKMAEAAVRGFASEGVTVVAKHFAAQGETTGGVNASAARIGERELREIHLPPMQACVAAGVGGVMAAYNEIDGVYCHANPHLLKDILRNEMGFDGFVMADGLAIDNLAALTGDRVSAGALAISSGVDVSLWDEGFSRLEEAVTQGLVSEEELNRAVLRVLTEKYAQGLFEKPYLKEQKPTEFSVENYPQSLKLAEKSIVLLENKNNLLPLKGREKIALIGPHGSQIYDMLGDYSPALRENEGITIYRGLQEALAQAGKGGSVSYEKGSGLFAGSEAQLAAAVRLAEESDVVVLTIGGSSSRFGEVCFDANGAARTDGAVTMDCGEGVDSSRLELPAAQRRLAECIYQTGKPVIVLVISGRPMLLQEEKIHAAALFQCFYPGPMGGRAIAEVLFGAVSPSGLLPVSLPRNVGQLPMAYNHKASYSAFQYYDEQAGVLYPFGYGLSYSSFSAADAKFSTEALFAEQLNRAPQGETVCSLQIKIKNTGGFDAETVLLLYLRGLRGSVTRRVKELKSFVRTALKKGEEQEVTLTLSAEDFKFWNAQMEFCAEPGAALLSAELQGETVWEQQISIF